MNASPNLTDPYDPMAGTLAGSYARAGAPTAEPGKINIGADDRDARTLPGPDEWTDDTTVPDPWAQPEIANLRNSSSSAPGLNINILALDLGTKLGWALRARDGAVWHGTEVFTPRKSWTPGQRWLRARSFVTDLVVRHQVHAIAYEDVKRHAGTDAAHAYGAFLCLVQMVADSHRAALMPVGVGTIKKHWTGKGNADKAAMEAQARARGFRPESDNDADALAILHWAVAQERKA
ncbi:hypothetical protein LMG7053_04801 [Achromobacter ruhlandii]|uniref:Uncharacterized protein n=1 Tax=Achromobacter ruhlandii TaxID=72557 RepID=A0ABM8M1K5_9BURK|nr:hypothetical protein [Achromobacter ruhlandii]CAB3955777.1 hypothetical protein LMG7053_04801 [Achromobacter ruhlandii]